ncbi:MAG: site-2 protease family protein [Candidatus Latescibacterota bacterium]|nr:MAG: site-2 protease family protein [Candidatus Latescibacterota bacterium]
MNALARFVLSAPGILLALTVHEVAHGWAAYLLGDPTARRAGRLTFNPLAHLDPMGTIMLFVFHFGWARPVPVDPYNLRNPKRDMLWISLAGPVANIITAFLLGRVIRILAGIWLPDPLLFLLYFGLYINLVLAFFNLIPVPPLDGSKVLVGLLPPEPAYRYTQLERYGPFVLIAVLLFDQMVFPVVRGTVGFLVAHLARGFLAF